MLEYLDISGTMISDIHLKQLLPKCPLLTHFYANEIKFELADIITSYLNLSVLIFYLYIINPFV